MLPEAIDTAVRELRSVWDAVLVWNHRELPLSIVEPAAARQRLHPRKSHGLGPCAEYKVR